MAALRPVARNVWVRTIAATAVAAALLLLLPHPLGDSPR